jgi:hypothetical protein
LTLSRTPFLRAGFTAELLFQHKCEYAEDHSDDHTRSSYQRAALGPRIWGPETYAVRGAVQKHGFRFSAVGLFPRSFA